MSHKDSHLKNFPSDCVETSQDLSIVPQSMHGALIHNVEGSYHTNTYHDQGPLFLRS